MSAKQCPACKRWLIRMADPLGCQDCIAKVLRAQLAAATAAMDRNFQADVDAAKSYPGIHGESFSSTEALHWYEEQLTAATERAEKAEAQFKSVQPFLIAYHSYVMQHYPPGYAVDSGNVALTINNIIESKVKDAEARAVAHWAECEAWRAAYKEWSEGDYHFREPTDAREASDRARNPTIEPPTHEAENPQ